MPTSMAFPLIVSPRPALRPWIHHIMVMGYGAASISPIPAVLNPNIIVFPRGSGCLEAADGTLTPLPRASLKGPCLAPQRVHCRPGSVFVSILFRAGFMAEALGPGVGEFRDRVLGLDDLLQPGKLAAMLARMDTETDPAAWADLAQDLLLDGLRAGRSPRGTTAALGNLGGLFTPARRIAADLGIGVRQLERRMDQAYGASLREVRRMVRFGYCFARLTSDAFYRGNLTRIAQDFGYYDQAHMNRDFKALAGATPGAILEAAAGGDPGLWLYRLGKRNFHDLFLSEGVDSVQESFLGRI